MAEPAPLAAAIGVVDGIYDLLNVKQHWLVNWFVQPYDSSLYIQAKKAQERTSVGSR